jgi:type IV pilus assembly protein PilB
VPELTTGPIDAPAAEHGRDSRHASLGVQLISAGLVSAAQVEAALVEQRRTGKRLGEILVAHDVLFEDDLARTLAEITGMPYRDLSLDPPDPAVLHVLPEAFCRRRGVLPVGYENGEVVVAITDPRDIQTLDDLRTLVDAPFRPVVAAPGELRRAIESAYYGRAIGEDEPSDDPSTEEGGPGDTIDADMAEDPTIGRDGAPVITFVNQLLTRAAEERASDVHIEPTGDGLRIRFRVDGMLHDVMTAPASLHLGVVSRIKIMTGMDIAQHRLAQDGRMSMVIGGRSVDIRGASLPTIYGRPWYCACSVKIRDCSTSASSDSFPVHWSGSSGPSARPGAWSSSPVPPARERPPPCTPPSTN